MNDPRLNLPSASSFSLTALCAGRETLLRSLPPQPEAIDEDADRGTKLHAAWEREDTTGLDTEDTDIYERGLKLVEETVAAWKLDVGQVVEGNREERFYLHNSSGDIAASGQADRHYLQLDKVLVLDFKSLYAKNLVPSEQNWQAKLLSVLVAREYGSSHVRFAFLKAMFGKSDTVDYGPDDLKRAEYSIRQALWESKQPDAQRRAGPHCRFCKANAHCPEAMAWAMLPSVQTGIASQDITPKNAAMLAEGVSLFDCAKIERTKTSRRNLEDACSARLKRQDAETLAAIGLKLGKPQIMRPITNPEAAFNFLRGLGIPEEKLWSTVNIGNGELAIVVQEELSLKSNKEATEWIRSKLSSCISEVPKAASLEKIL